MVIIYATDAQRHGGTYNSRWGLTIDEEWDEEWGLG